MVIILYLLFACGQAVIIHLAPTIHTQQILSTTAIKSGLEGDNDSLDGRSQMRQAQNNKSTLYGLMRVGTGGLGQLFLSYIYAISL